MLAILGFFFLNLLMVWGLDREDFWHQILFWLIGILLFLLFRCLSAIRIFRTQKRIYFLSLIFLALPLFLGRVIRGSNRWIEIGIFSIQPSELVKPFLIGILAYQLTKGIRNLREFIILIVAILVPVVLILSQPDLGSAGIIFISLLSLTFIAKPKISWWFPLLFVFAVLLLLGRAEFFRPYQIDRIKVFLDPYRDPLGRGYNLIQAQLAIGAGGWFGRGFGLGRQTQLAFLPEKHTDFIFSAVAEELGFLGVFFTLGFYIYLFHWLTKKIADSENTFIFYLRIGVFIQFLLQTAINLAMNLGLFPIVGVPLPFVSYGGSSLISALLSLGLIL